MYMQRPLLGGCLSDRFLIGGRGSVMGILLDILDLAVLLLVLVHVPRTVWRTEPRSLGSHGLSILMAIALFFFSIVSFTAGLGLIEAASSLARGVLLVVLIGMAVLLRLS